MYLKSGRLFFGNICSMCGSRLRSLDDTGPSEVEDEYNYLYDPMVYEDDMYMYLYQRNDIIDYI